ncbi:MAG: hypothetical protein AAFZ15_17300 [Bacteroidota bacterium]
MKRRKKYVRKAKETFQIPKKITANHAKGAALGITGETVVDHFTGGFLTDSTGRWIKIVSGLGLLFGSRKDTTQGVGVGLVLNNGYAKFISEENMTLGDEIKTSVLPAGPVEGRPLYLNRRYAPQVNGLNRMKMAAG